MHALRLALQDYCTASAGTLSSPFRVDTCLCVDEEERQAPEVASRSIHHLARVDMYLIPLVTYLTVQAWDSKLVTENSRYYTM